MEIYDEAPGVYDHHQVHHVVKIGTPFLAKILRRVFGSDYTEIRCSCSWVTSGETADQAITDWKEHFWATKSARQFLDGTR